MNIWSEMMTALRGGIDELGETMQSQQAVEILDKQIREVDMRLQQKKEALAKSLISHKQAEQQIKILQTEIEKYEGYALKALEQNDEKLALEVAEQVAILETELREQRAMSQQDNDDLELLRQYIRQSEQDLLRLKHQRDTVKASTNVQNAQESILSAEQKGSTVKPKTAKDVLERIKKKQQLLDNGGTENNLQEKLKKAGIIDSDASVNVDANSVLQRIKSIR